MAVTVLDRKQVFDELNDTLLSVTWKFADFSKHTPRLANRSAACFVAVFAAQEMIHRHIEDVGQLR